MLLLFISCLLANAGGRARDTPRRVSVAVGIRLERTFHRHADVVGLLLGQTGDHATEALDHFQRHFLVQLLGQHFHAQQLLAGGGVEVGIALAEQVDLGQHLVGEGAIHDAAGVTGGIAQVHQAALGQQDQVVVVGRIEAVLAGTVDLVYLRLDLFPGPVLTHEGGIDLVVEVTDVAHHGALLQRLEHVGVAHVDVAGGGDDQVGVAQQLAVDAGFGAVIDAVDVGRGDLETVHAGLHGTDRVGFGHAHYHAFLAQGLGRALAHVTITDDQRLLAGQQVVGGALDGIVQAVTAAVLVVVLALGHRVVDVDRRYLQGALLQHLQQAVYAGGGFLGDAVNVFQYLREALVQDGGQVATIVQHHVGIPGLAILEDGLLNAPDVFFFGFAFPGKYRNAGSGNGGGGLVLSRENVAG